MSRTCHEMSRAKRDTIVTFRDMCVTFRDISERVIMFVSSMKKLRVCADQASSANIDMMRIHAKSSRSSTRLSATGFGITLLAATILPLKMMGDYAKSITDIIGPIGGMTEADLAKEGISSTEKAFLLSMNHLTDITSSLGVVDLSMGVIPTAVVIAIGATIVGLSMCAAAAVSDAKNARLAVVMASTGISNEFTVFRPVKAVTRLKL